jgi:hypothetical protein
MVAALEEPLRRVVLLRYVEGLSSAHIARALGVPAGTVRWQLKTAMDRLRARLDAEHDGERRRWVALLAPIALANRRAAPVSPRPRVRVVVGSAAAIFTLVAVFGALHGRAPRSRTSPLADGRQASWREAPVLRVPPPAATEATVDVMDVLVVDEAGAPVPGAFVHATSNLHSLRWPRVVEAVTDAQGRARLPGVRASTFYEVSATAPGHAGEGLSWMLRPGAPPLKLTLARGELTVSGVVEDIGGGPVAGALVALVDDRRLFTRTDQQGRFRLWGKMKFSYAVVAEADGYAATGLNHQILDGPWERRLRLAPGGCLEGTALEAGTNHPLAGVTLDASAYRASNALAETDESGRFSVCGLPAGEYSIVSAHGPWRGRLEDLHLTTAQRLTGVAVELRHGFMVKGRVLGDDGRARADVEVTFDRRPGASGEPQMEGRRSAADGTFEVAGLLPGPFDVWLARSLGRVFDHRVVSLDLRDDVTGLELRLPPGATLRGRVHRAGAPLPGAHAVVALSPGPLPETFVFSATTDGAGRFVLGDLPAGEAHIAVAPTGSPEQVIENLARALLRPGETTEVDLDVATSPILTGTVTYDDGQPAVGVVVSGWRPAQPRADGETRTDARGAFELVDLGPGPLEVRAHREGLERTAQARREKVALAAGERRVLHFVLPRAAAFITGMVRGRDGAPAAGVDVLALPPEAPLRSRFRAEAQTLTEVDGTFRLGPLPEGTYSVRAFSGDELLPAAILAPAGARNVGVRLGLAVTRRTVGETRPASHPPGE